MTTTAAPPRFRLSALLGVMLIGALAAMAARPMLAGFTDEQLLLVAAAWAVVGVLTLVAGAGMWWLRQRSVAALGEVRWRLPAYSFALPKLPGADAWVVGLMFIAVGVGVAIVLGRFVVSAMDDSAGVEVRDVTAWLAIASFAALSLAYGAARIVWRREILFGANGVLFGYVARPWSEVTKHYVSLPDRRVHVFEVLGSIYRGGGALAPAEQQEELGCEVADWVEAYAPLRDARAATNEKSSFLGRGSADKTAGERSAYADFDWLLFVPSWILVTTGLPRSLMSLIVPLFWLVWPWMWLLFRRSGIADVAAGVPRMAIPANRFTIRQRPWVWVLVKAFVTIACLLLQSWLGLLGAAAGGYSLWRTFWQARKATPCTAIVREHALTIDHATYPWSEVSRSSGSEEGTIVFHCRSERVELLPESGDETELLHLLAERLPVPAAG